MYSFYFQYIFKATLICVLINIIYRSYQTAIRRYHYQSILYTFFYTLAQFLCKKKTENTLSITTAPINTDHMASDQLVGSTMKTFLLLLVVAVSALGMFISFNIIFKCFLQMFVCIF